MGREDGLPAQHRAAQLGSLVIFHRIIMQGASVGSVSFSCCYCRIKRLNNEVHISHCSTGAEAADIITPPMSSKDFLFCLCNICSCLLLKTIIALFMVLLKGFFFPRGVLQPVLMNNADPSNAQHTSRRLANVELRLGE